MTVLVNGLSAVVGGGVTYLNNLLPRLAEQFETRRASLKWLLPAALREQIAAPESTDVEWVERFPAGPGRLLWERRELPKLAQRFSVSTVFTTTQTAAILPGVRNVLMLRNMEPFFHWKYPYDLRHRVRNCLLRELTVSALRRAEGVIAVSDMTAEYCTRHLAVDKSKVTRIYHGRDEAFAPAATADHAASTLSGLGIDKPYVFTCGSLLPYRRAEHVIESFVLAARELDEEVMLVIAGTGNDKKYQRTLERVAQSSPASAGITFLGHVDKTTLVSLYQQAVAFMMASEIEACPNVAIEAMTASCAVVSLRQEPLPEIFGDCAMYFENDDVAEAADHLTHCFRNSAKRQAFKRCAYDRSRLFSWDSCAEQTADFLLATA